MRRPRKWSWRWGPYLRSSPCFPKARRRGRGSSCKGTRATRTAEISSEVRELIALGVAAQVPCAYCVYAHTAFAKADGATDAEVQEAIAYAAEVRLRSTILNGSQYDLAEWKTKIDGIIDHVWPRPTRGLSTAGRPRGRPAILL